mmetsp:Transcript_22455/g.72715  ORF Transcript_22455/g.72715 Transcript_22455/m.72715 type:complete len:224 (+) Transcript_22455:111-782(+)
MFARFCVANSVRMRIAAADSACNRGSCCNAKLAKDHANIETFRGMKPTPAAGRKLIMAPEAIASSRGMCAKRMEAKAQAMFVRPWGSKSPILGMALAAIASSSGSFVKATTATDHAMLDRSCGDKSRLLAMAADAIAANKGLSKITTLENAQDKFDSSWLMNSGNNLSEPSDIACIRGKFKTSKDAKAHAVLLRSCGAASAIRYTAEAAIASNSGMCTYTTAA